MREGVPERGAGFFRDLGVRVEWIDVRQGCFPALGGIYDPGEKREAITQTFYRDVLGRLVQESGAEYLLQGTIRTDVDETGAPMELTEEAIELDLSPRRFHPDFEPVGY